MSADTTFEDLEAACVRHGAQVRAAEVHAYLLGRLTTGSLELGLGDLLEPLLKEDALLLESPLLNAILGHMNHLFEQTLRGAAEMICFELREDADESERRAFAEGRADELEWYLRGVLADRRFQARLDPPGREAFSCLIKALAYLRCVVDPTKLPEPDLEHLVRPSRDDLLVEMSAITGAVDTLVRRAATDRTHPEEAARDAASGSVGRRVVN